MLCVRDLEAKEPKTGSFTSKPLTLRFLNAPARALKEINPNGKNKQELEIMQLIANAGESKTKAFAALQAVQTQDFAKARSLLG